MSFGVAIMVLFRDAQFSGFGGGAAFTGDDAKGIRLTGAQFRTRAAVTLLVTTLAVPYYCLFTYYPGENLGRVGLLTLLLYPFL